MSTSIEIDAPAMAVWSALADFDGYRAWNPFICEASGRLAVGSRLTLRMFPAAGRAMTFRPTVLAAVPGSELRWNGRLFPDRLFPVSDRVFHLDRHPPNPQIHHLHRVSRIVADG
ncbi:SRPBCC family protein [Nonomuraea sp. H19]|uniref:SRPBCC family protein n=1 Tax=Nonomuraea sp. H19 TaxID=3452206 RepID=UPI003F8A09F6